MMSISTAKSNQGGDADPFSGVPFLTTTVDFQSQAGTPLDIFY